MQGFTTFSALKSYGNSWKMDEIRRKWGEKHGFSRFSVAERLRNKILHVLQTSQGNILEDFWG